MSPKRKFNPNRPTISVRFAGYLFLHNRKPVAFHAQVVDEKKIQAQVVDIDDGGPGLVVGDDHCMMVEQQGISRHEWKMLCVPLGDTCVLVNLGDRIDDAAAGAVACLTAALESHRLPGVQDVVPAFTTVAVHFDPSQVGGTDPYARVTEWVRAAALDEFTHEALPGREFTIPVCYDEGCAPDLPEVARRVAMSEREVVARHTALHFRVGAIGFSPGFPYLVGLPPELQVPRRETPRTRVPAGSVAIGGPFAGIYPSDTPGGWHLVGRTARVLFDPARAEPCLLRVGDHVRFVAVRTLAETEGVP